MRFSILCGLALCIISKLNAESCNGDSMKNAVRIGGLFPAVVKRNGRVDTGGIARQIAALLAVEEINDKTDGIMDKILPQHKVELFVRDSKRDAPASILATFKVASQSYGQVSAPVCGVYNPALDGVHGVIGPASSGPSIDVQTILTDLDVAQIGYSATSADLSNNDAYPFFVRTPPPDDIQAKTMAILIRDLLRDNNGDGLDANLVIGIGSYSQAGGKKFREIAKEYKINIRQDSVLKSESTQAEYDRVVRELEQSHCHLTVMFGQLDDIAEMLERAHANNYKSTWLLSESAVSGHSRSDLQTHIGVHNISILRGVFTTAPSNGYNRPAYNRFEQRWLAQASTRWMQGGKEVCSNATDASGQYLWRRTLNNGKEVCLGKDFELAAALRAANACNSTEYNRKVCDSVKITQYAPFAYEAMQAMLLAFHAIATRTGPGPLSVTAKEVYEEMLAVDFTGITGQVAFNKEGPGQGDRVSDDLEFVVYNHDGERGFNAVGSVRQSKWKACNQENFSYPCEKYVFFDGKDTIPTVQVKPLCTAEDFDYELGDCGTQISSREVTFQWKPECSDGLCCEDEDPPASESVTCNYIPATSVSAIGIFFIAAISVIICIAVGIWMVINRDTREVIGSQPMFCVIILVGAACVPISSCFLVGKIQSYKCILSEWFIWFGFSVCLSALAVKVLRVYLLFVKFTFKKNVASLVAPWKTVGWMIGMIMPMLLLLIVRTAIPKDWVDQSKDALVRTDFDIVVNVDMEQCTGLLRLSKDLSKVASTAALVTRVLERFYIVVIMFAIGIFSFKTRKVPQRFSEARWIQIGFYNTGLAYIIFLVMEIFWKSSPGIYLVVFALVKMYMSMAIVVTLFVPKMRRVYKYRKYPEKRNQSMSKRKRSRAEENHESKEIQHILDQLEPVGAAIVEKLYRDDVALKSENHELKDLVSQLRDENCKLQQPVGSLHGIVKTIKRAFSSLEVIESKKNREDVMESKKDEDSASGHSNAETDGDSEFGGSEFEATADVMESKTRRHTPCRSSTADVMESKTHSHVSSPSFLLYDATESKTDAANSKKVSVTNVSGPATKATNGSGNGSHRSNGHGIEMVSHTDTLAAESNAGSVHDVNARPAE